MAESIVVKQRLVEDPRILDQALDVAQRCAQACREGNKVLFMGNGGSAADAQHLAGEFVSRFNYDRPGLASFALTVDTSVLTAIGNDYGYDKLFERQVQACARSGDVVVGLSTSGNSVNVIKGLDMARVMGAYTVGMTGESGGQMKDKVDACLCMPSRQTPRIQECHILIGHVICGLVEQIMFPKD
ncbi:D-sedoheptulose 7-phosphate isomerase [Aquabacterium olei]|nr:D-sedoheptulose 7-phosphate isomerase [Aquabacterium olei]